MKRGVVFCRHDEQIQDGPYDPKRERVQLDFKWSSQQKSSRDCRLLCALVRTVCSVCAAIRVAGRVESGCRVCQGWCGRARWTGGHVQCLVASYLYAVLERVASWLAHHWCTGEIDYGCLWSLYKSETECVNWKWNRTLNVTNWIHYEFDSSKSFSHSYQVMSN